MTRIYKAGTKVAKLLDEFKGQHSSIIDEGCRISRQYGGSQTTVMTKRDIDGDFRVVGFVFKYPDKVDKSLFRRSKIDDGAWLPKRSSNKGRKVAAKLETLRTTKFDIVHKAIGMKTFVGFGFRHAGAKQLNGHWYLIVPDDVEAKGCRRVSDVAYEKLLAQHKASRAHRT